MLKTLDEAAVSYQIVLTKADQVKQAELEERSRDTAAALQKRPAAFPEVLATSSRTATACPSCVPRSCGCGGARSHRSVVPRGTIASPEPGKKQRPRRP